MSNIRSQQPFWTNPDGINWQVDFWIKQNLITWWETKEAEEIAYQLTNDTIATLFNYTRILTLLNALLQSLGYLNRLLNAFIGLIYGLEFLFELCIILEKVLIEGHSLKETLLEGDRPYRLLRNFIWFISTLLFLFCTGPLPMLFLLVTYLADIILTLTEQADKITAEGSLFDNPKVKQAIIYALSLSLLLLAYILLNFGGLFLGAYLMGTVGFADLLFFGKESRTQTLIKFAASAIGFLAAIFLSPVAGMGLLVATVLAIALWKRQTNSVNAPVGEKGAPAELTKEKCAYPAAIIATTPSSPIEAKNRRSPSAGSIVTTTVPTNLPRTDDPSLSDIPSSLNPNAEGCPRKIQDDTPTPKSPASILSNPTDNAPKGESDQTSSTSPTSSPSSFTAGAFWQFRKRQNHLWIDTRARKNRICMTPSPKFGRITGSLTPR